MDIRWMGYGGRRCVRTTLIDALEIATQPLFITAWGGGSRFGLNGRLDARRQPGEPGFCLHARTPGGRVALARLAATVGLFWLFRFQVALGWRLIGGCLSLFRRSPF